MMGSFTGKTAIVTGASRGIGRAIAMRLAKDGAKTVLCARDVAALEAGVKEIKVAGGTATSIALDLRLPGSPAELADFAAKRFDGIDIVVNNAGATKRGAFLELTDDDWADGFALKFLGAVRLTRAAWPYLKFSRGPSRGRGHPPRAGGQPADNAATRRPQVQHHNPMPQSGQPSAVPSIPRDDRSRRAHALD
jgi:NAD(P)-dependent dehydrogenase (short-subunit alcohol dehydrogenase family)